MLYEALLRATRLAELSVVYNPVPALGTLWCSTTFLKVTFATKELDVINSVRCTFTVQSNVIKLKIRSVATSSALVFITFAYSFLDRFGDITTVPLGLAHLFLNLQQGLIQI